MIDLGIDWNQVSSIITAIATAALAIFAYYSFKGMKDQMNLIYKQSIDMKRQADAMEVQANIMDGQTNFVRNQAYAMEKQSNLMLKNIEYDQLNKKYERINKEMTLLVAPLYSRRNDERIFKLKSHTDKFKGAGYNKFSESHYDFINFWESIEQNKYLNRSPEFQLALHNFLINILDYYTANENALGEERKRSLEELYSKTRKPQLIDQVEKRYVELSKEIRNIEGQLKILE